MKNNPSLTILALFFSGSALADPSVDPAKIGLKYAEAVSAVASSLKDGIGIAGVNPENLIKISQSAKQLSSAAELQWKNATFLKNIGINTELITTIEEEARTLKAESYRKAFDKFDDISGKIEAAGNVISAASTVYSTYKDIEKYGLSATEAITTFIITSVDTTSIFLNKANPLALLGVVPALMELKDGSPSYEYTKNYLSFVSDPLGTSADIMRLGRESIFENSKADVAISNSIESISKMTDKYISSGYGFGATASQEIIKSESAKDFEININNALNSKRQYIKSTISSIDSYIKEIEALKGDALFTFYKKELYLSMIEKLNTERDRLHQYYNKLNSNNATLESIKIYAEGWLIYGHEKNITSKILTQREYIQQAIQPIITRKTSFEQYQSASLNNIITGIAQGNNSHFGSANLYSFPDDRSTGKKEKQNPLVDAQNNNNAQQITGLQQSGQAQNTIAFKSSDWVIVSGDVASNYIFSDKFGSIAPPNNGSITALNNSGIQEASMQKTVTIPVGVKQVTVGMMANFVTNEYPRYVGSKYNDQAIIEIRTGSGNTYQATLFNKELNSANFQLVNGLPSPMGSSGGQTGFENITKTIPVANGGQLVITVKTINVGDKSVPSATLINSTTAR